MFCKENAFWISKRRFFLFTKLQKNDPARGRVVLYSFVLFSVVVSVADVGVKEQESPIKIKRNGAV